MSEQTGVVSAETLAKLLMMTDRHLRRLVADGWIPKTPDGKYTVVGGVQGYIRYLKDEARRGMGSDAKTYMSEVKARLAQEQADHVALKNAQLRGELVPLADVETRWAQIAGELRAGVLAVSSRYQQQAPGVTTAEIEILDRELRETLRILGGDVDPP